MIKVEIFWICLSSFPRCLTLNTLWPAASIRSHRKEIWLHGYYSNNAISCGDCSNVYLLKRMQCLFRYSWTCYLHQIILSLTNIFLCTGAFLYVPYSLLLISNKFWYLSLLCKILPHCVQSYRTWALKGGKVWALKPLMYIKIPMDIWLIWPVCNVFDGGKSITRAIGRDLLPSNTLHMGGRTYKWLVHK